MAPNPETRTVLYAGNPITYQLHRKKVKNINLRIRQDSSVTVSAHNRVPTSQVDAFVAEKGGFILDAITRLEEAEALNPPHRYIDGEVFYLLGQPLVLQVTHGVGAVVADDTCLYLTTPNPAKSQRLVQQYMDRECRRVFGEIMSRVLPLFQQYGFGMPSLKIRTMKTRWGSCSPAKAAITLNKKLLEYPEDCIEYVVVHEFCHFVHPNHSHRFYRLLEAVMPDWKARKVLLNNFRRG